MDETYAKLIAGIMDYFSKNNFSKAVIGLSGGIDSSVSAFLAVRALGSGNVTGILMPEEGLTSEDNIRDALEIVKTLRIRHYYIPINDYINKFKTIGNIIKNNKNNGFDGNSGKNELAFSNAKARIRMCILYYFANLNNALVVGTSNKSESFLGYATKYGDAASDILPIGDLWKTEVIELGKFLKIPEKILRKTPSAELIPGVTDEKELGAPYEVLDKILRLHFEKGVSREEIISNGFDAELAENVFRRIKMNEHKGRMPFVVKVF